MGHILTLKTFIYLISLLFIISCSSETEIEINEVETPEKSVIAEETPLVETVIDSVLEMREEGDPVDLITVVGSRDFDLVVQEVKRHLITINWWYHREKDAKREERISVKFTIDQFGIPHDVELIETTFENMSFPNRVLEDIPQWRFVKLPGDSESTSVIYPITLRPVSQTSL